MRIVYALAGALGGVIGQVLGAAWISVDTIRFGDDRPIPLASVLFLCSWVGFVAALTAVRRPRAAAMAQTGAMIGLIVVALMARVWSLGVPIGLLALSAGYALRIAQRQQVTAMA